MKTVEMVCQKYSSGEGRGGRGLGGLGGVLCGLVPVPGQQFVQARRKRRGDGTLRRGLAV